MPCQTLGNSPGPLSSAPGLRRPKEYVQGHARSDLLRLATQVASYLPSWCGLIRLPPYAGCGPVLAELLTPATIEAGHCPMVATPPQICAPSEGCIPSSMIDLSSTVQPFLATLKASASDSELRHLRECFDAFECPSIDYDRHGPAFAHAYFLQNYWKACLAFLSHPTPIVTKVLDVGSGSGATAVAYLAYLDSLLERDLELELVLLDRSSVQMELAKRILALAVPRLRKLRVHCEYCHADIVDWKHRNGRLGLILQGHVLTENRDSVAAILSKMADSVSGDGRIFTIERKSDSIWEPIEKSIPEIAYSADCETTTFADELAKSASAFIPGPDLTMRLMVLRAPERKIMATLVKKYFAAWELQRTDLLDEVFDRDAEYREKPQDSALRGLGQIKQYWVARVLPQRNIRLQVKKCSYTANEATAEWIADFNLHDKTVKVRGVLVLKLNPHTGLVSSLREYFTTTKT